MNIDSTFVVVLQNQECINWTTVKYTSRKRLCRASCESVGFRSMWPCLLITIWTKDTLGVMCSDIKLTINFLSTGWSDLYLMSPLCHLYVTLCYKQDKNKRPGKVYKINHENTRKINIQNKFIYPQCIKDFLDHEWIMATDI